MNRYNIFILTVIALIGNASCTKPDKLSLYIVFDSVRNLKGGSEVYCKNVAIGKVDGLKLLADYKVLVKVNLNKSIEPAKQDTFALVNYDYFGSQVVEVISSKVSDNKYVSGDTVRGVILDKEPLVKLDSVTRKIARDSLIIPHIRK